MATVADHNNHVPLASLAILGNQMAYSRNYKLDLSLEDGFLYGSMDEKTSACSYEEEGCQVQENAPSSKTMRAACSSYGDDSSYGNVLEGLCPS